MFQSASSLVPLMWVAQLQTFGIHPNVQIDMLAQASFYATDQSYEMIIAMILLSLTSRVPSQVPRYNPADCLVEFRASCISIVF